MFCNVLGNLHDLVRLEQQFNLPQNALGLRAFLSSDEQFRTGGQGNGDDLRAMLVPVRSELRMLSAEVHDAGAGTRNHAMPYGSSGPTGSSEKSSGSRKSSTSAREPAVCSNHPDG